jgi:hypothetical protein
VLTLQLLLIIYISKMPRQICDMNIIRDKKPFPNFHGVGLRHIKAMLSHDLAELYGVENKALNRAVKLTS